MPRRIFPAGTVTNTTGAPLRLEFYPTSTSVRRETDMWTVDGSNNLAERITNGVIVTDSAGAYSAFAGPDDLDTLYALPNNTSSRTTLTASAGQVVPGDAGPTWATPAASTTLTGTLAAWVITAVDCTAGAGARTLPAASSVAAGTPVCAKKADTSTNNLVVSRAGSDLIFGTGSGATSKTLSLAGEAVEFVSNGVSKWTVRSSDTPSGILATTFAALGIAGREAWKSQFFTALRPFHVALGDIATAPVSVLFVGDSRPEGAKTTNIAYALPQAFADLMRRRFQPSTIVGGFGYIPTRYAQVLTGIGVTDNIGGALGTAYGLGRRQLNFTGAAQTITFTFTGTGFDLYYRTDPSLGVFSYNVDAGGAVNITPTAANGTAKTSVTGLSVASHTVVLARVSGTTVVQGLVAFNGDEAAGLRVYDGGHSGYKVSDYTSGSWVDDVSLAQPSLVVISLLTNDFGGGAGSQPRTAAQAQADLGTLMTNIAAKCTISPSFVVEAPSYPDNALSGNFDAWTLYVAAAYAAAAARTDCVVLDTYKRWGSLTSGSTVGGLNNSDKIHQTNAGYRTIASALADLVSPA